MLKVVQTLETIAPLINHRMVRLRATLKVEQTLGTIVALAEV